MSSMLLWLCLLLPAQTGNTALTPETQAELRQLEGRWQLVSETDDGKEMPAAEAKKIQLTFEPGGKWQVRLDGKVVGGGTLTLDPRPRPKTLDYLFTEGEQKGARFTAIYELDGATFRHCGVLKGDRPADFSAKAGTGRSLTVFRRIRD